MKRPVYMDIQTALSL